MSLDRLTTEARNPQSEQLDSMSPDQIVDLMSNQDQIVVEAVRAVSGPIAAAIELVTERVRSGGRLVYMGAGTSGRLGVLDASECPPTFNTPPELVVGLIAGGPPALVRSAESMEDHPEYGRRDLEEINFGPQDTLMGIATSGRTPYVIGGMQYAQEIGAATIGFACNAEAELAKHADIAILPVVGPEIVSGSTRLKSGTATKMVLNMISTGTMIRLGKTYGNLMVDLRATNSKLVERSRRIVAMLTDCSEPEAEALLKSCDGELKTAVVMQQRGVDAEAARRRLTDAGGQLRGAL